jgi:hypothetical protein
LENELDFIRLLIKFPVIGHSDLETLTSPQHQVWHFIFIGMVIFPGAFGVEVNIFRLQDSL